MTPQEPTQPPSTEPSLDRLRQVLLGLLLLLVVLAWLGGLHGEFTYDDKVEVAGNRTIRFIENWKEILSYNASRPVVVLSWALDWRLWGQNTLGYHALNVLIHALNAALVLLVGQELIGRWRGMFDRTTLLTAFSVAALWALHPMTTESVTYVTGRSESLCATFYLAAILYWLRWRREGGAFAYGAACVAFLLGILTKEVAVTIPLALAWIEISSPSRPVSSGSPGASWRRVSLALLPFFLTLAALAVARKMIYGVFTTDAWIRPPSVQLPTQAEVVLRYLGLWLAPLGQSVFHDHPAVEDPFRPWTLLAFAGLALLIGLGLLLLLRRRAGKVSAASHLLSCGLPFAVGWYLLTLLPSSAIIPLKETMAEHRAYLAGIAVTLTLVLLADRLLPRSLRLRAAVLGLALATLGALTLHRNHLWSSEVTLWHDAVKKNSLSAEAWYGYGDALRFSRRFDQAIEAYEMVTALRPDYLDAWNNLGIVHAELGRSDQAREIWMRALRKEPSYCKAHNNLGWLAFRAERWDEAMGEFRTTLTWCPNDVQANYGLGNIYFGPKRDVRAATRHYEAVLALDPEFVQAAFIRKRLLGLTW